MWKSTSELGCLSELPRHRTDAVTATTSRRWWGARNLISTQVIAHRIKTIVDSDQILVLDRGHLIEDGAPAELIARNGAFAEMVRASRSRSATNLVAAANS